MKRWICLLGGAYTVSYSILYFNPQLIHEPHSFRFALESNSTHIPSIVAHRGGYFNKDL